MIKGTTPVTINDEFLGKHSITLIKGGYVNYNTTVVLTGKTSTISALLTPIPPITGKVKLLHSLPEQRFSLIMNIKGLPQSF